MNIIHMNLIKGFDVLPMKREIRKGRLVRRAIINLILAAFFVWIVVSLAQPVSNEHKPLYVEHSSDRAFELVRLEPAGHGQELTFYNESDLHLQSK
jgi:hypothetical protein